MTSRSFSLRRWGFLFLIPVLGTLRCGEPAKAQSFLPDDRWIAVGDSITENGQYQKWLNYFYAARRPEIHLKAFNGGVAGTTVGQALSRVDWDIASRHPSVVTVMFGMNDLAIPLYKNGSGATEQSKESRLELYQKNLETEVTRLRQLPARVIILTPTIYEQSTAVPGEDIPGVNDALARCAQIAEDVAIRNSLPVIDIHHGMNDLDAILKQEVPAATMIGPDRIHPNALGQFAVATLLFEGLGTGDQGQRIDVDAGTMTASAQNASVDGLAREGPGVKFLARFQWLPLCLPDLGAPPGMLAALKHRLGEDVLKVTNLPEGQYEVFFDNKPGGVFSSKALSDGLRVADLPSFPPAIASRQLLKLVSDKAAKEAGLRIIAWLEFCVWPDGMPATATPDMLISALEAKIPTSTPAMKKGIQERVVRYAGLKAQQQALIKDVESLAGQIASWPTTSSMEVSILPANPPN